CLVLPEFGPEGLLPSQKRLQLSAVLSDVPEFAPYERDECELPRQEQLVRVTVLHSGDADLFRTTHPSAHSGSHEEYEIVRLVNGSKTCIIGILVERFSKIGELGHVHVASHLFEPKFERGAKVPEIEDRG